MDIIRRDRPSQEEMIIQSAQGYVGVLEIYKDGCEKKGVSVPKRVKEAIARLQSLLSLTEPADPGRKKLDEYIDNTVVSLCKDIQTNNPEFLDINSLENS